MNFRIIPFVFLASTSLTCAETPTVETPPPAQPSKWTVTGNWFGKHAKWSDMIAIRPDGTFSRSEGGGGKWRLSAQGDHPVLELNWDSWQPEVIDMISPDIFRGSTRSGKFELRRVAGEIAVAPAEKPQLEPEKEFDDPALKSRLTNSVWQLQDGKQFTLHSDGSTTGDWHTRKGSWRIIGPNQVQLTITWREKQPSTVAVDTNGSILRWPDTEWAQIAKRLGP
jgi:hypothetical protein